MDGTRQRIPSLFTNPVVLAVVGLFFFGALLARRHELAVLAVLVGALMGTSRLWTGFSPKSITCELSVDRCRVFPGETVELRAELENGKLLPVHLTLRIASSDVVSPAPGQPETLQSGTLLWFQRAVFTWIFTALKRGIHQLGPPRLASGDLLGFYSRNIVSKKRLSIVVFPRLVPLKPVRLSRRDLFGKPGGTGMLPDPLYIVGTRDYQARAPARHIHWKASARHLRVQEKVFEPSFQEKVLFIVQVDGFIAYGNGEPFERTLEVVASLSVRLQDDGHPVGLATNAVGVAGPLVRAPP